MSKKLKKIIKVLELELEAAQYGFDECIHYDLEYTKNPKVCKELMLTNHKLMDQYLYKIETLEHLKERIYKEIGK